MPKLTKTRKAPIQGGPIKYHGGKSYYAAWIQSLAPPKGSYTHRIHPYAGGLGELWSWTYDGVSETVNDSNDDVTCFYDVLRDEELFGELSRFLTLTPFSEIEWARATRLGASDCADHHGLDIQVAKAAMFFVRNRMSRQGLGRDYSTPTRRTRRGMNEQVSAYLSAVDKLPEFHERLRRVEVLYGDALDVINKYDHPKALFYLDPPYLHDTRVTVGEYGAQEMTRDQHIALLKLLRRIEGKFMLSAYHNSTYDKYIEENSWEVYEKLTDAKSSSAKAKGDRIELIICNY